MTWLEAVTHINPDIRRCMVSATHTHAHTHTHTHTHAHTHTHTHKHTHIVGLTHKPDYRLDY